MARGPIPDLPPNRPTISEVLPLVLAYYQKPQNGCGGSLHIVLDDGNLSDSNIEYCRQYAHKKRDTDGERLAELLLRMSTTQRRRIYSRC